MKARAIILAVVAAMLGFPELAYAATASVTFAAHVEYALGGSFSTTYASVAAADVNGDTHLDLISPNFEVGTVSVLLSNGDGTFAAHADFATGTAPSSVAAADVNGDWVPDLVVANAWSDDVSVLLGDGDGTFGPQAEFYAGDSPWALTVTDVNGDSAEDVVVANNYADTVSVLYGHGDGTFDGPNSLAVGHLPNATAVADVNGDTVPDLLVDNGSSHSISVLLGRGGGSFAPHTEFATQGHTNGLAVADLDGDGTPDVTVANNESSAVSVLRGNGDGTFATPARFATGATGSLSVVEGDLNGDGVLDVATTGDSDVVSVLLGDGTGTFGAHTEFATAPSPWGMATADLNGDGRFDLATVSVLGSLSLLMNTTPTPTVPGAPTIGRAVVGYELATVSWTAPASGGGSPLTGYVVTPYVGAAAQTPVPFSSTATTQRVTGLTNGTTYTFKVAATNPVGTGPVSGASNAITLAVTVPTAPAISIAVAGDQSATIAWTAPASDGGSPLTAYVVSAYVGFSPVKSVVAGPGARRRTITGLTNGTTYRFRVRAFNSLGPGPFSHTSNALTPPATVPAAATIGTATAGYHLVTLSWTAPASDGGSPITGYVVTPYVGHSPRHPTTFDSTATTQTVTGLVNGTTYRFRVQAVNAVGIGPYSTLTNPATPTA